MAAAAVSRVGRSRCAVAPITDRGPVGFRGELLRHELRADQRQHEETGAGAEHGPVPSQRGVERAVEPPGEARYHCRQQ